jgi:2-polyprenyl-6-methoxyphenol hydroxylase-like FAD-dependent oxidoreductase
MRDRYSSAVVLGASMSGLLAARALSGHFERITVVDRDMLPMGDELRKGVPQAVHAHGLLASGCRVMNDIFPGMMEELEARGAPVGDIVGDFVWFQYGRWKLRRDLGLRGITVSRPCLEAAVRRRVKALPNVAFLEGTIGVKLAFDAAASRVTGLLVRPRERSDQEILDADLVIDASDRGGPSRRSGWRNWASTDPKKSWCGSTSGMRPAPSSGGRMISLTRSAASLRARRPRAHAQAGCSPPRAIGGWSHWGVPWATTLR